METKKYKNWWFLTLNGLILILAGLLFIFYAPALLTLIINTFGFIILGSGLFQLILAIYNLKREKQAATSFILAVIYITLGICILVFREASQSLFFIMMGVWAVMAGIMQLIILVNVKKNLPNKNIVLFNGLLTILFGAALFFNPVSFPAIIINILGVFAVIFGIIMIYLSFVIRNATRTRENQQP